MKKKIFLALLFLVIIPGLCVLGYFGYRKYQDHREHQEWLANAYPSASENVAVWRDSIFIPLQNDKRSVHVYLPPGYHDNDSIRYPVIYMLDGGSAFDMMEHESTEWEIDEVIDSTVAAGGPGAIVIGIESAPNRDQEYTPWPIDDYPKAHGEAFMNWLCTEFKPMIDRQFRTQPATESTTIGGISRSGMMAYYAIMSHPETFGRALIQSPSMWVDEERLIAMEPAGDLSKKRIFVSVGELEAPMVPLAQAAYDRLARAGITEDNRKIHVFEGLGHWHITWQQSFAMAYPWIIE
ncbi:MAG: alpha/beta hydrolase-fold protein [Bacteroidota bacterium]